MKLTKKKVSGSIPITDARIFVTNKFDKPIHIIITPNSDYVLAETLIAFASLAKGALGLAETTGGLFLLLRTLSFMKKSKDVIDKLKTAIPKSSMTLYPGQTREVLNAYITDPFIWKNPTGIAALFGGSVYTMLITDEDFKNTVMFNTKLQERYEVDKTGVSPPMHFWNGGYVPSGLLSSASPSLTRTDENNMLMLYRDSKGNRIFLAEFKEGNFVKKDRGWLRHDTKHGVGVTVMRDKLCVVGRHAGGEQMFALWDKNSKIPFDTAKTWMGPDIAEKPSATTIGDTTYIVARHLGTAVMWAILRADGTKESGNTGLDTMFPPSIHAYKGKLYMYFTRRDTNEICVAVSTDGKKWKELLNNLPRTSAGVALTIYKNRLYIFYRDGRKNANGVFYMWTEDGLNYEHPHPREHQYFGFDVEGEPTASPMPGDNNGIMVAGVLPTTKWSPMDPFTTHDPEALVWTILKPWEPDAPILGKSTAKKTAKTNSKTTKAKAKSKPAVKKTDTKKAKHKVVNTASTKTAAKKKTVVTKPKAKKTVAKKKVSKAVKATPVKRKMAAPARKKAAVSKPKKVVAKKKVLKAVKAKPVKRKVAAPVKKKAVATKKVAAKKKPAAKKRR